MMRSLIAIAGLAFFGGCAKEETLMLDCMSTEEFLGSLQRETFVLDITPKDTKRGGAEANCSLKTKITGQRVNIVNSCPGTPPWDSRCAKPGSKLNVRINRLSGELVYEERCRTLADDKVWGSPIGPTSYECEKANQKF